MICERVNSTIEKRNIHKNITGKQIEANTKKQKKIYKKNLKKPSTTELKKSEREQENQSHSTETISANKKLRNSLTYSHRIYITYIQHTTHTFTDVYDVIHLIT